MNRLSLLLSVAASMICCVSGATAPNVSGPLPVTPDSVPFLAADRHLQPVDLKNYGYVEEEFIVSGKANVYDWAADGTTTVKTPAAPYATRILVRRPAATARSSSS